MVDDNHDLIWRWLRGLGVPEASLDDATQQVFWIAAQKLTEIEAGSERAFLLSTARGVAANERRAEARKPERPGDDVLAAHVDHGPSPEEAASMRQRRQVLEQILASMAEELRAVFVLFELEGYTSAAIAELLGIPAGTAASRLRRAREEFQAATKRLLPRGGGKS